MLAVTGSLMAAAEYGGQGGGKALEGEESYGTWVMETET